MLSEEEKGILEKMCPMNAVAEGRRFINDLSIALLGSQVEARGHQGGSVPLRNRYKCKYMHQQDVDYLVLNEKLKRYLFRCPWRTPCLL